MNRLLWIMTLLALLGCGGCFHTPIVLGTSEGVNAGRYVGPAGSWTRPLKVGRATREQVVDRLGPPHAIADNGREIAYSWKERHLSFALLVVPVLDPSERTMLLRFDGDDELVAFEENIWQPAGLFVEILGTRGGYPDPGFSPPAVGSAIEVSGLSQWRYFPVFDCSPKPSRRQFPPAIILDGESDAPVFGKLGPPRDEDE